jgi:glycosyltransferase involved in cell wall biosynthesis
MNVLYITYDGLLDPLGGSQILPYIYGISSHQDDIIILSFEKQELLTSGRQKMLLNLKHYGIHWKSLKFTRNMGMAGKFWDLICMYIWAYYLSFRYDIQVVHARSHSAAQVGLLLKKILGKKLIFDFRGLWVDERVDKGGWDLNRLSHRIQYKYFKRVEKKLLAQADQIVTLTKKAVGELAKLELSTSSKITVIPCCADFDHFFLSNNDRKLKSKLMIGAPYNAFIVGYLGSIGEMYMMDRFFYLFELIANSNLNCHAMVITKDVLALEKIMNRHLSFNLHSRVHVASANRDEVPTLLPAMDLMISFIMPSYARMAAFPTKISECFAAGIPIITNSGIGDVELIINELDGGRIVDPFSDQDMSKAAQELDIICEKGGVRLRNVARPILGLELAFERYNTVYESL